MTGCSPISNVINGLFQYHLMRCADSVEALRGRDRRRPRKARAVQEKQQTKGLRKGDDTKLVGEPHYCIIRTPIQLCCFCPRHNVAEQLSTAELHSDAQWKGWLLKVLTNILLTVDIVQPKYFHLVDHNTSISYTEIY